MVTTTVIVLTAIQFTHMNTEIVLSLAVKKIVMLAVTYRARWMVVSDSGRI